MGKAYRVRTGAEFGGTRRTTTHGGKLTELLKAKGNGKWECIELGNGCLWGARGLRARGAAASSVARPLGARPAGRAPGGKERCPSAAGAARRTRVRGSLRRAGGAQRGGASEEPGWRCWGESCAVKRHTGRDVSCWVNGGDGAGLSWYLRSSPPVTGATSVKPGHSFHFREQNVLHMACAHGNLVFGTSSNRQQNKTQDCVEEGFLIPLLPVFTSNIDKSVCSDPPDQPGNVSCIQDGRDGNLTCTWDKGRLTHIDTTYVVQLTNETECLRFAEDSMNPKYGSLNLTKLNFESNYTAVVAASNRLGNASSLPFTFMLIDIVKPHSPTDILVKFDNVSATNCTVLWQDQQQTQSFRLRYRPVNSHSWNMVETLNSTRYNLHDLKPHREYEFQVCCKFHPNRGMWSDWSTFRIQTPEAVPSGLLDVWYVIQDMDSQTQNITLFWKVMSKSEARGKILHYTLTFQALNQKSPRTTDVNITTQTHFTRVLPKVDYNIMVYAHNSKGNSSPTSIITDLSILDLPPPQSISVTPMGNNSIFVIWAPPIESAAFNGYIVEWAKTCSPEPHLNWIKFPASNLSTIISVIHKETSSNSFLIKNLQRGVNYVLWMTASTMAGESPMGNEELVYLESASEWMIVSAACIVFGISACICFVQSVQKALCSLLSVLVPQWYRKAIPDPANSTWAKKYSSVENELNLDSSQFLSYFSSFEEPETIEVEEVFIKREPVAFKDIPIFNNIENSECHDWQIENSFEKQESTEKNSEYKPLAPSTPDDGDNYKCHLPYLYKKVVLEETEQIQTVSEYLTNPLTDMTVNYLPSNILSPIMDTNEESNEFECKSFSIFPTTSLLMPMFSCGGKLTLDAVKIDCNSFTD
ncbi:pleckstrin homology-like domain family B member 2 [Platysternon megacephalum]|uniref:Pleckstrin homology-like domain family B member 2 n=1 Tax=Platysternon megacephalum TaxID=55544 RepID=A0A4D9E1K4_9SAUR|nr:pleckstrin homology-like domain family B member 2 [Platysternon megacephalum]